MPAMNCGAVVCLPAGNRIRLVEEAEVYASGVTARKEKQIGNTNEQEKHKKKVREGAGVSDGYVDGGERNRAYSWSETLLLYLPHLLCTRAAF